ncbi:MAG TPA: FtsX-like permease family protein [Dehalococcoidia bacterium]|jgi:putative ABC transport system permease protein|nr:FtsX-like permease family protein [Dehalococcoidia bacterium]
MVPIARRNLLADKVKLLVAVGGVTLAIVLIIVVNSLYQGVRRDMDAFVRRLPGDVWIVQQGTTDLVFSNSNLPANSTAALRDTEGVHQVYALNGRLMAFEHEGREVRTYVMALHYLGGSGAALGAEFVPPYNQIILDNTFAKQAGLSEGELLKFGEKTFKVADVRSLGNVLVTQFAFIPPDAFRELFEVAGAVNYFLIVLDDGADPATVMPELAQQVPGSTVYTTEAFAARASEKSTGDFLPIIRVILAISFIVGLAVLSLVIYSATIERAREYAIMKVIGASPAGLYRIVLSQSIFIAVVGFGGGVGLAFLFNEVAGDLVPQFITYIRGKDIAMIFGVTLVMSIIASFMPINRVARVEPATVFRA